MSLILSDYYSDAAHCAEEKNCLIQHLESTSHRLFALFAFSLNYNRVVSR